MDEENFLKDFSKFYGKDKAETLKTIINNNYINKQKIKEIIDKVIPTNKLDVTSNILNNQLKERLGINT